jgi:UDP-N-acetylmuramate: L-alanyl-gamma-D-glutamyl-meso-diaminopimelate ligase
VPEMRAGDVVALLSNGGFGGIYEKLPQRLKSLSAANHADAGSQR